MARVVRLATCQALAPAQGRGQAEIEAHALRLLDEAGEMGVDIACLPECLNVVALLTEDMAGAAEESAQRLTTRVKEVCARNSMYAVLPLVHRREGKLRNSAFIIGRGGEELGVYHKVHCTPTEREEHGFAPGDEYSVFELDFGRIGVMVCYDGCFPETARILALNGAEIVFFPSLQRSYTETHLELQVRARAFDNFVHIVRSSYGTEPGGVWTPGTIVGKSCIVSPDGTILADLGRFAGVVCRDVDLDALEVGPVTFGGEVGIIREMRTMDRRPETYSRLCE